VERRRVLERGREREAEKGRRGEGERGEGRGESQRTSPPRL